MNANSNVTRTLMLPFMTTLSIYYLKRIIHYPIQHDPTCLPIPTKQYLDILTFKGSIDKGLYNHIIHMRFSNNIVGDKYYYT